MADNVGYTPGVGATVAADEISGVLHQRVKIGVGGDGVAVDVSSTNPMPVTGTVSTGLSQPLTDSQLRATPVPVSGTVTANTGLSQPLTDSQLRASPVPVSGTFYQPTQPVSIAASVAVTGPLTDSQLRATPVPVSGTVTANTGLTQPLTDAQLRATAVPVSGTFYQTTQPISAASLPLPSGAATSAKQPALGTAGTASSDVITVQGIASMTALKVDGSGVTQPVSGTFWQATQPISAASLPLPSGAATETTLATLLDTADFNARIPVNGQATMSASLPVVIASDQSAIKNINADAVVTTFSQSGVIAINTILMTLDLLNYSGVNIQVASLGATGVITPEWSIDNVTWVTSLYFNPIGTAANSISSANIYSVSRFARYLRLRLSTATTSGTTTVVAERMVPSPPAYVATQNVSVIQPLQAGTNLIGDVGVQYRASSTGAASGAHLVSAATTNATVVKASAGRLLGWSLSNTNAAWRYVKLHNQTTTPTAGSGVVRTIGIPPNNTSQISFDGGIAFSTGIALTTTTGAADADATAVGANDIVGDLFYA